MNFDLSKPEYEQFDREIMELMTKMLSKDPKERFSASDCLNHASLQI
jgi:serine/threonine protein kinase